MSILERPLLRPQQRLDLEDWEVLLSGLRTDSNFYTKRFLADTSYILKGFTISQSFIGQTTAEITLDGSTLINGDSSEDFSWWTAPIGAAPLTIPAGVGGVQAGRNFVEIRLLTSEGTPLQRAFWDPTANSGSGAEFTNEVNTVQVTDIEVVVNQTAFSSGDPDLIPVAIIDVDGSFIIQGIQDKRKLFFRLGTPDNPSAKYSWVSQTEPTTELTMSTPSGIAFQVDETVTFTSGATATVVSGGTTVIEVTGFSSTAYNPGDGVVGGTSGASAVLGSYYEDPEGADKSLSHYRDLFTALQTEISTVKGTQYWYEQGSVSSLLSLLNYVNAILSPVASGARIRWTGSNVIITDDSTSGQATSDVIAAVRLLGTDSDLLLTRQDDTGGSTSLGVADGSVLYLELPTFGSDRTYSENGSGTTNYKVVTRDAFVPTDTNFWIAYREGSKLIVRGSGELQAGEEKEIGDETTSQQLAFTGAESETDSTPPYTTLPDPGLSNQFTTNDSLTQAISINAANINDIISALINPYQERLDVVLGAPADDNEITGPITPGTTISLPLDSRNLNAQKEYLVGSGSVFLFFNGIEMLLDEDFSEVGVIGALSSEIEILRDDIVVGDVLELRIINPQVFGTSGLPQPYFVNYITGQAGAQVPVGNLYNITTNKLQVYRNGALMSLTLSVGDLIDRYSEPNNNSILLSQNANTSEVFTFINYEDPVPSRVIQTGVTGTILTIPTYTLGDDSLRIYRNGVLMTTGVGFSAVQTYAETSTTTVTLDVAASASDVFVIYGAGSPPTWRETLTGVTGTTLTIPNSQTYVLGDEKLLVFRNGLLLLNSTSLASAVDRYQEFSTTQIELGLTASASDFFEFIYVP